MSRYTEEELRDPESSRRESLAEHWARVQEDSAPVRQGISRASLEALQAEEEDESVRIYKPRRAPLPAEPLPAAADLPKEDEEDEEEFRPRPDPARRMEEGVSSLLRRLRGQDRAPRSRPAEDEPEPQLPSFEELIWGEEKAKSAPVRILDEDEAPARPDPGPAEVEIHIPEAELAGLSVNAILSETWEGLPGEEPARAPRRREEAAAPSRRSARSEAKPWDKSRLLGWLKVPESKPKREAPARQPVRAPEAPAAKAESAPALDAELSVDQILSEYWEGLTEPESAPAPRAETRREQSRRQAPRFTRPEPEEKRPAPLPEPAVREEVKPAPAPAAPPPPPPKAAEPDPAALSVDEILADFWSNYTEQESQPVQRDEAPRSRREAARLREVAAPVPPTGAASSAAENRTSVPRRGRKERASRREERPRPKPEDEDDQEEERPSPSPRRKRGKNKNAPAAPAPVSGTEQVTQSEAKAPAPQPPVWEEAPGPAPAPAAPSRRRREIIDEDVDFGAMSVDDILAEYNDILAALPEAAEAVGAQRQAESAPPAPAETAQRGQVSRMQDEARDLLQQMRSGELPREQERPKAGTGLRREPVPPKAEPAQSAEPAMPSLADGEWSSTLKRLLGQDPAPPQPAAAAEPSRTESTPVSKPRRSVLPSEEVDPRFNLSGQRKSTMVFDGKELDLSADESYVPPKPVENVGFHWVAGEEELPDRPVEKQSFFRRRKAQREERAAEKAEKAAEKAADSGEGDSEDQHSESYDDRTRPAYAPDRDYEPEDEEDAGPGAFPSFGQYLSALVSGVLVRLLGARRQSGVTTATMEDEEDLGPEVSPAAASKHYGSYVTSLRLRVRIGLALLAVMTWIALGLPVSGALRSYEVSAGLLLAMQLGVMLLSLDVVTGAAVNMARGRFGADSLAVLSCVLTSLDALAVCLGVLGSSHTPLCLISSMSLLGVLLSSLVSARGLRKALRVPAIGKRCYGVTAEAQVKGSGLTLLKSLRPPKGFVRRAEEASPDESLFLRLAPILGLLSPVLALIVAIAKHAYGEYLYILTAILCPAVPLTALLAFALPYLFGSLRIFHSGAAIAGWSGVCDIGRSDNLIVTDRDLFPEGSVEIDTVRIFAEVQPETVISYAGTMVCASGSDLAPCFAELMEKNGCPMRRVEGFTYLAGGGMKGVIDGSVILCGGLDLMRLMNVRVPYRLVGKTTVLLAVDGILCGIFNMKYEGQPQVRKALVGLIRSNRHPVFAIRDFLVTPDMLSECFEVATDGYDFPPYVDRFAISEAKPSEESKLAAVVCREGLGPLSHMADTGRSVYVATRLNLLLTTLAAVLGVFVAFFRLLSVGTVGSGFLLLFLLLWALPVAAVSVFLRL